MEIFKRLIALENDAADFGFRWENPQQIIDQIRSELDEISVHLHDQDKTKLKEEIGDLMHAVFSLCIFCQLNPQSTLEESAEKFQIRFNAVKKIAAEYGLTSLNGKSFEELMFFWEKAKNNNP